MANVVNIGSPFLKFQFVDGDGEVFASFRLNPMDVRIVKRCEEVGDYFESIHNSLSDTATIDDAIKLNDEIEARICHILGYDAREALFGMVSATAIMEDGNMFAIHVMEKIIEAITPEIQKRKIAMANALREHTQKYT